MSESVPLRWLYLDLNSYFASVEQQLDPSIRGRPVVVAPVHTDSTSAIAASYEAKAFGIRTGTKIYEAKALCRDLVIVPGQHEEYVRFHHRIIEEVGRHVPVTAVCSIDEVACRLMDNENGIAEVTALAARIKAGIRANVGECLTSSIGVAPNRLLAKMAADMKKPDGLTILPAESLKARLSALPLSDIPGVGRNMERRLNAVGIVDMARLLALDEREARLAWGSVWGERMHWLLQGADLAETPTERRSIGHSHVLGPEKRTPERARLVARRLLAKAATRLRRAQNRTKLLGLSVKAEDRGVGKWSASVRMPPVMDTVTLLVALEGLWRRMLGEFGARRLLQVGVTLSELGDADAVQLHLFEASMDAGSEVRRLALSRAMDRVNERFGRDAVTMGHDALGAARSSGPRIAFTRIPELAEFHE
ncbi:DNA polymerase IV [Polymorphobacter glacialis]|uniref:DNA-directed DNA polymerase n=1 Tax=Sandarakinorhabdus glacialis TaxID=1614636 RepID=A0A916ZK26_9SPHN|nr:type VI secretion protein ImpB [Polymorphobacter glacialis]GGE01679.1 DNA polymerase IV [Polymorphobacter glacialis]